MVKEVGVVEDTGAVAMGTREVILVVKVLAFIGVNNINIHQCIITFQWYIIIMVIMKVGNFVYVPISY